MQGLDYAWPAGAGAAACRIDVTLTGIGETWPAKICLSVRKGEGFSTHTALVLRDNLVSLKRDTSGRRHRLAAGSQRIL